MHVETDLLVHAIESIKPENNLFKDYIFPLIGGFISAILGFGVAYLTVKHQEEIQTQKDILLIEKDKMDIANKWTLLAEDALASLMALKYNYINKLNDNPIQRAFTVPAIIFNARRINEDILGLTFIVPKKDDKASHDIKWRQITLIRAMIKNYNSILDMWDKRNEIDRALKIKLNTEHPETSYPGISKEVIVDCVGEVKLLELIDLTERAIKFTDDILIELDDFLNNFPDVVRPLIQAEGLEQYGSLLSYNIDDNPVRIEQIQRIPDVDFDMMSELFHQDVEALKIAYSTGYE